MDDFKNKKIVITGSSRGIGETIGKSFLKKGAKVIFTGTTNKNQKIINKNAFYVSCDLTTDEGIERLYNKTNTLFKSTLDILICNIGDGKFRQSHSYSKLEWENAFNINLFSSIYTIQKFLDLLETSKSPSITCISSICGNASIGCPINYSVAKSALISYVKNISKLIAKNNIRINSISPGNILFPNSTWDIKLKNNKKQTTDYIENNVPLQKFGNPENISNLVLFLSSNLSDFTTGSNFVLDGGQLNV